MPQSDQSAFVCWKSKVNIPRNKGKSLLNPSKNLEIQINY